MGGDIGRVIPAETVRATWAANPSGTQAMWIRDRFAGVFGEENLDGWFPADGRRGLSPMVLVAQAGEQQQLLKLNQDQAEKIRQILVSETTSTIRTERRRDLSFLLMGLAASIPIGILMNFIS